MGRYLENICMTANLCDIIIIIMQIYIMYMKIDINVYLYRYSADVLD